MKKLIILFLICYFLLVGTLQAEQITLTTYYPSPAGSYSQLRLVPRGIMEGECRVGTFYTLKENGRMFYCKGKGEGDEEGEWNQVILIESIVKIENILKEFSFRLSDTTSLLINYMEDNDKSMVELIEDIEAFKTVYEEEVKLLHQTINDLRKQKNKEVKHLQDQINALKNRSYP